MQTAQLTNATSGRADPSWQPDVALNPRNVALTRALGQPGTLHWLMWQANIGADLKEKRVGHVQRFTHGSLGRLMESSGLRVTDISYSMHWAGQIKDILMHAEEGPGFPRWASRNPLYRVFMAGLWAVSYVESAALARFPANAVALHVTAVKPPVLRSLEG